MTDRELKKLSRNELLDMLIYQAEENKKLRDELEAARLELLKREIAIEKSGSLAEASMYMSNLFDSADRAAKIYLENIERKKRETDELCEKKVAEAQGRVEEIVSGAIEAIRYYGGNTVGVCSIIANIEECGGLPVTAIFHTEHLWSDFISLPSHECPLCKTGVKLDAMVNTYGFSSF